MRTFATQLLSKLAFLFALVGASSGFGAQTQPAAGASTTVIVVRHAEKATDDPRDPSLSPEGERRAQALATALEGAAVSAIYATQYRRTRDTGAPLAEARGLEIEERPVTQANSAEYAETLRREILSRHAGGTVLVVGHSNTVPLIARTMSGRTVADMTEAEYDHFYMILIPPTGPASLLHARYGEASAAINTSGSANATPPAPASPDS